MFGLGFGEILIILVLALVLLGPQKLPEAAKQLGKGLREFKKATDDLKQQFEGELYSDSRPQRPKLAPAPAPAAEPAPAGPALAASAANVPGLEAALAEPAPSPASAASPAPAPAAAASPSPSPPPAPAAAASAPAAAVASAPGGEKAP